MICVEVRDHFWELIHSIYLVLKITFYLSINFGVHVCTYALACMEVREQLAGVSSLSPLCRFCGLNSSHQA